jgi:hypothetical protein
VVTETRTVEVPVEVIKPLPKPLTDPIPYPPPLPAQFDFEDLNELIHDLYDLLDLANADRLKAAELTAPAAPAPDGTPP